MKPSFQPDSLPVRLPQNSGPVPLTEIGAAADAARISSLLAAGAQETASAREKAGRPDDAQSPANRDSDRQDQASARLFLAVPLPDNQKRLLADRCALLRTHSPFGKWVNKADYHVTLQYLGETPLARVEAIQSALGEALAVHSPFEISLGSLGSFGRPASPQILWTGVKGDLEALSALQADVVKTMIAFGYEPEDRPYAPHITLARKYQGREPFDARTAGERLPAISSEPWRVKHIVLYESKGGRLPMYHPVAHIPLGADPRTDIR